MNLLLQRFISLLDTIQDAFVLCGGWLPVPSKNAHAFSGGILEYLWVTGGEVFISFWRPFFQGVTDDALLEEMYLEQ